MTDVTKEHFFHIAMIVLSFEIWVQIPIRTVNSRVQVNGELSGTAKLYVKHKCREDYQSCSQC